MRLGTEVCTAPGERWYHAAAMFDDKTMLIYGGFSQYCDDFCDDLWMFDQFGARRAPARAARCVTRRRGARAGRRQVVGDAVRAEHGHRAGEVRVRTRDAAAAAG